MNLTVSEVTGMSCTTLYDSARFVTRDESILSLVSRRTWYDLFTDTFSLRWKGR
jgi:hypothetical protein